MRTCIYSLLFKQGQYQCTMQPEKMCVHFVLSKIYPQKITLFISACENK